MEKHRSSITHLFESPANQGIVTTHAGFFSNLLTTEHVYFRFSMPAGAKRRRRNGRHEIRRLLVDTITAFGNLIGVGRVREHIELEHRKRKQRVSGRSRERFVLLGGQRRQARERLICGSLQEITFPACIITATWDVLEYNEAFCRFNIIDRLFLDASSRRVHGSFCRVLYARSLGCSNRAPDDGRTRRHCSSFVSGFSLIAICARSGTSKK